MTDSERPLVVGDTYGHGGPPGSGNPGPLDLFSTYLPSQAADDIFHPGCAIAIADLDADETPEIIVGCGASGSPGTIEVYDQFGNKPQDLQFWDGKDAPYFQGVTWGDSFAVADLDGDGFSELVVGNSVCDISTAYSPPWLQTCGQSRDNGTLKLYGMKSRGAPALVDVVTRKPIDDFFAAKNAIPSYASYGDGHFGGGQVLACDLNGDGFDEIITADTSLRIFSNPNHQVTSYPTGYLNVNQFDKIACADFVNKDGKDDILFAEYKGNNLTPDRDYTIFTEPSLKQAPARMYFTSEQDPVAMPGLFPNGALAAGDLDGDGYAELITVPGLTPPATLQTVTIWSVKGKTPPKIFGNPLSPNLQQPLTSNYTFGVGSRAAVLRQPHRPKSDDIIMPFHLQQVVYAPPGGRSSQQFVSIYGVSIAETWQEVTKTGTGVKIGIEGLGSVGLAVLWEDIKTGGVAHARETTAGKGFEYKWDIPSGLRDAFLLILGTPGRRVATYDTEYLTLNLAGTNPVTLYGQDLLAIAESWPNVRDVLSTDLAKASDVDLVLKSINAKDAKALLKVDPNFAIDAQGHVSLRAWDDVRTLIETDADWKKRFIPELCTDSKGALCVQGGNPKLNTAPVGPGPGSWLNVPGPATSWTHQLSITDALSSGSGTGTDTQLTAETETKLYFVTVGRTTTYEVEYQSISSTTTTTGAQDTVTLQMSSPCIMGTVDIYIDSVFGAYLYVPRSLEPTQRPSGPHGKDYDKICGNGVPQGGPGRPFGMACSGDSDCVSKSCVNGLCAESSCSGNCKVGDTCGEGSYLSDCSEDLRCELGTCALALYRMVCFANSVCATGSCSGNKCAVPACSGSCVKWQGCALDSDCKSQVCTEGICVSPLCSPTCEEGVACESDSDCITNVCGSDNKCAPPACSPGCKPDEACGADKECYYGQCSKGKCVMPTCASSGVKPTFITTPADYPPPGTLLTACDPVPTAASLGTATAKDACGIVINATPTLPATWAIGPNSVVWTATDLQGNKATYTQTVTISVTDLGVEHKVSTVKSNACLQVSMYPVWKQYMQTVVLQTQGTGSGWPIPYTYKNGTGPTPANQGAGSLTGTWQQFNMRPIDTKYPAIIKLNGNGAGSVSLTWWGNG